MVQVIKFLRKLSLKKNKSVSEVQLDINYFLLNVKG